MKKILLAIVTLLVGVPSMAQEKGMDEFISELMGRMTLREKIGQLNLLPAGSIQTGEALQSEVGKNIADGDLGGIFNIKGFDQIKALQDIAVKKSRLGIPLIVGMDVIHGYETVFPIPLALSCSWDVVAVEQAARIAATECSADGINWTYSPMVDVALDQRWGRVAEGNGEDPYLSSCMAAAMVRGYQGDYSAPSNIMACLKHYAMYGAAEAGKDYNLADMSHVRMYNQYLPPYKAAVEAGVGSVMSSFNVVDYVPATANRWLMTDLLRNEWGFCGFTVTDYASIAEILNHGTAATLQEASVQALTAGTDMDMCARGFVGTLAQSVSEGLVSEEAINTACRRVLEAKYKLGLFANPYRFLDKKRREKYIFTTEHRQAAREIAAETFVLLKNEGQLLPLKKEGKIALIGPLANNRANMSGTWSVAAIPDKYSTLKESMERAVAGKATLLYAQGSNICADAAVQQASEFDKPIARVDDAKTKSEALQIARQADVIVCAMGESADMSGECGSRTDLRLPDVQRSLLAELVALGKPVVLLNFSGRATVLTWEKENVNAIMNVWFGGSETGDAICDVLFGDKCPSGKLTVSMPRNTGQLPLYYNHLQTGRPVPDDVPFRKYQNNYLDTPNGALYPFGYGLSYTTFSYSNLTLTDSVMTKNGNVKATITVSNTGNREADEIVQLYIRDLVASISRPVKELRDFQRIHLRAGESRTVSFDINAETLSFYNSSLEKVVEPGDFTIMIGGNSSDLMAAKLRVE